MIRDLLRRLSRSDPALYECRRCGTELAEEADGCPNCGSTEIARYDIEE